MGDLNSYKCIDLTQKKSFFCSFVESRDLAQIPTDQNQYTPEYHHDGP